MQAGTRKLDCRQQPKLTINCYVRMHRSTMTAVTCAADVTTCLSSVNNISQLTVASSVAAVSAAGSMQTRTSLNVDVP